MKTIKLILSAILMMMAFTVQAQTVQVYKDGAVVKEYPASEIESVEVKQVYYYYAGWECPTTEEELARLAVGLNGEEIKELETMAVGTQIRLFDGELTHARGDWFIVIPTNVGIYGPDGANSVEDTFAEPDITSITNYKIFTKRGSTIAGYMIKKD